MMDALLNLTAQMAREGIRRLLVLSGDESWTLQQAQAQLDRLRVEREDFRECQHQRRRPRALALAGLAVQLR